MHFFRNWYSAKHVFNIIVFRILKEAEKREKIEMAKREKEAKHQLFMEEKKRKQEERQEEKLKKLHEIELKRQQNAIMKEQVKFDQVHPSYLELVFWLDYNELMNLQLALDAASNPGGSDIFYQAAMVRPRVSVSSILVLSSLSHFTPSPRPQPPCSQLAALLCSACTFNIV